MNHCHVIVLFKYGDIDSVQPSGWLPYQRKKRRRKTSAMTHLSTDTSDTSNSMHEVLMKESYFGIPKVRAFHYVSHPKEG